MSAAQSTPDPDGRPADTRFTLRGVATLDRDTSRTIVMVALSPDEVRTADAVHKPLGALMVDGYDVVVLDAASYDGLRSQAAADSQVRSDDTVITILRRELDLVRARRVALEAEIAMLREASEVTALRHQVAGLGSELVWTQKRNRRLSIEVESLKPPTAT